MQFYTVFAGPFNSPKEANKNLKKINKLGFKGYLFSVKDNKYALKISSSVNLCEVIQKKKILLNAGFPAYLE